MTRALTIIRSFDRSCWLCLAGLMALTLTAPFWALVIGA